MPPEKHEAARDAGPLCTETASAVNEEMDILSRRIFILIAAVAALLLPGGMLKAETAPVVKDGLRGIVTDIVTGEPLIGAGILVEGSTDGAVTDLDGSYVLELGEGTYSLSVSYIG